MERSHSNHRHSSNIKLLIVEDEINSLNALIDFFTRCGFNVRAADNGADAIAAGAIFEPDVLLCDWLLADDCDGVTVARALYARDATLNIIFVTAHPTDELAKRSADIPIPNRAILSKPVSLYDLRELVERVVE